MDTAFNKKLVYGKRVRTNNQNTDVIHSLWHDFLRLNLKGDIFAVYTNYASDFTSDYDLLVGTEKPITDESSVIIPTGTYHVIDVDHTDPNGVINAWIEIWKSDIKRAYQTDFEYYSKDGSIKIFLSIEQ